MTVSTHYQVKLKSDKHGVERFAYESLGEAMAGHERVTRQAEKHTNADQVKRVVTLQVIKTVTSASHA